MNDPLTMLGEQIKEAFMSLPGILRPAPAPLTAIGLAEARLSSARTWHWAILGIGLTFCTVIWMLNKDMEDRHARWRAAALAATGKASDPEASSGPGIFWFGMVLIGISQIKGVEMAVRQAELSRLKADLSG